MVSFIINVEQDATAEYIYNIIMAIKSAARKEKIQLLAHIVAGITILLHGYEKYEHHESSAIVLILSGIVFLTIALFHKKLAAFSHLLDSIFLLIEAICLAFIAADYFNAGKQALPWCYVFAAAMYVVVAFIKYRKNKVIKKNGVTKH